MCSYPDSKKRTSKKGCFVKCVSYYHYLEITYMLETVIITFSRSSCLVLKTREVKKLTQSQKVCIGAKKFVLHLANTGSERGNFSLPLIYYCVQLYFN